MFWSYFQTDNCLQPDAISGKNGTVQLYLNMTHLSASQRASRQTAVFLFRIVLEFLTET